LLPTKKTEKVLGAKLYNLFPSPLTPCKYTVGFQKPIEESLSGHCKLRKKHRISVFNVDVISEAKIRKKLMIEEAENI
jgi:hypothetical protein